MKILYVITALGVGGAENLLIDTCTKMKDRHEIAVVFLHDLRIYEHQLTDMNIETFYLDYEKRNILSCIFALRKIITEHNYDIVHTHLPLADTIGRIAALLCRKVKVVSTLHGGDPWKMRYAPKYIAMKAFNCLTVNFFPRVSLIAVSHSVKADCMRYEKIFDKKITVIYNFIKYRDSVKSIPGFKPNFRTDKNYVVTLIARLEVPKGHMFFLKCLKRIKTMTKRPITALIIGDGQERTRLQNYVWLNNLSDSVHFLGRVSNVYDYIKNSDLFVLPSFNEGQSISILESFYCKTPVLASDIPPNVESLNNGRNGVLFRSKSADDFICKFLALMEDRYNTTILVQNGFDFCQKLSPKRHTDELDALMHKLTGIPKGDEAPYYPD